MSLLCAFDAATYEEAKVIMDLRMGWASQELGLGPPGDCPKCGAVVYPESTGVCWRCGFDPRTSKRDGPGDAV
jgi:uncharacterized OB-fold protein